MLQHLTGTTFDVTPDRNKFLIELTAAIDGVRFAAVTNWFEELKRQAPAKK